MYACINASHLLILKRLHNVVKVLPVSGLSSAPRRKLLSDMHDPTREMHDPTREMHDLTREMHDPTREMNDPTRC